MPLVAQKETKVEIEVQEVFPPQQEEKSSPSIPKRRKIKTLVKRIQKVIKKVIHFPSIPEPIPKKAKDEDDDDLPLS